jgi:hypothetical protein
MAIRFAVWKGEQRSPGPALGWRPAPPPRVLRVHAVIGDSGGVKPARRRFGHVAAGIREGMGDQGYPFRSL